MGTMMPIDIARGVLRPLLERQREGWSLEQPFYLDPAIFELERERWFTTQWVVAGLACEVPSKGSFIVRRIFGEELVIVRSKEHEVRAFYNVCTHRGSRICSGDGHAPLFVCPYHAWSFRLTGELQSRRDLPDGVDPETLGLRPAGAKVIQGVILVGLDPGSLPGTEDGEGAYSEAMEFHGFAGAQILARKHYPTNANWKLVLENFLECYHCKPSHPEYFRVNSHVNVTAMRSEKARARWDLELARWNEHTGSCLFGTEKRSGWMDGTFAYAVYRRPIGEGRKTLSETGDPVAPLMGGFKAYDGGETSFHFGRFCFASAANDHVALIQIVPQEVELTEVTITWLVAPGAECEAQSVTWMWDVTTLQDKRIVEENAAGVRSRAYRPGPYTPLESQTALFTRTYLETMRDLAPA